MIWILKTRQAYVNGLKLQEDDFIGFSGGIILSFEKESQERKIQLMKTWENF